MFGRGGFEPYFGTRWDFRTDVVLEISIESFFGIEFRAVGRQVEQFNARSPHAFRHNSAAGDALRPCAELSRNQCRHVGTVADEQKRALPPIKN